MDTIKDMKMEEKEGIMNMDMMLPLAIMIITKQDIKKDMPQVMKMDIILERTNMKMC